MRFKGPSTRHNYVGLRVDMLEKEDERRNRENKYLR